LRLALASPTFDIFNVEGAEFAALDLGDRSLQSIVFGLALLQQFEGDSHNVGGPLKNACRDLGIDELLLLWSKFNHVEFRDENDRSLFQSVTAYCRVVKKAPCQPRCPAG
jgi:hypothetical protein